MIENSQLDGGYVLCTGGKRIPFLIQYRERKRLAITVHPDLRLEVIAPKGTGKEQVLGRVEKRAAWVLRQQRYFEKFLPEHPGARYVSGETHLYLGRQYRLKVHQRATTEVKLLAGRLHIWTPDSTNTASIKMLLDDWYRDHANQFFAKRLTICLNQCPALRRRQFPHLLLRRMSHRWGSCTKAGSVLLNLDLIKTPTHCIDYVIVHELCHLHVHNHSPAFYRLLGRCMPDWERRKARLEQCRLM